jgi:predicted Zn-dependent peptidase
VTLVVTLILLTAPRASLADLARPVVERRLANGLRVVVCPDPASADVAVLMHYDVGSRDEPAGLFGLAHLVEHLMFTGSAHVALNEHFRLLERAGATNINGETSFDETEYHETVPPDALALALWLESDRLGYLLDRVDEAAVRRERLTVQNEQRHTMLDVGLGAAEAITMAELFPVWHPYHHDTLGTPASVGNLALADVRAFVSTWYGPSNATLVLAGKVEPEAAIALVRRYFETLPARSTPTRPPLPPLPEARPTVLRVGSSVVHQQVRIAWVTPKRGDPADIALDLAATILERRLDKSAVGGARVAINAEVAEQSTALASVFMIAATVAEAHTTDEVLTTIDEALVDLERAIPPAEIATAKALWSSAKLARLGTNLEWARSLASVLRGGPAPATFDGQIGMYAGITPAAVLAAVQRHLHGNSPVVMWTQRDVHQPASGVLLGRSEDAR